MQSKQQVAVKDRKKASQDKWSLVAPEESLRAAVESFNKNGFSAMIVDSGNEAREKVLELIPKDAEVLQNSSVTLDTIGVSAEINESGKYDALKPRLLKMDRKTQSKEMRRMRSAPDWAVGSAHAVTQDGRLIIASASGSQLPGESFGAAHVIFVVGGQKVVKDLEEGMKRLYEHVLPLESERAHKAYGVPASSVNQILILNKETAPGRITVILVKEALGF